MEASATTPGRALFPECVADERARNRSCGLRPAVALCAVLAVGPVWAQGALVPGESVVDRSRPELDPVGVPLGAFRLVSTVDLSVARDNNVFAEDTDEIDDRIVSVRPRFEVDSDWSRHALRGNLDIDVARYDDNGAEDYNDVRLAVAGRVDLSRRSALRLAANVESLHEDRSSPDDVAGFEPTEFDRTALSAGYAHRSGRIAARIDVESREWDYDDVEGASGIVNNDDRDRTRNRLSARAGFEVRPQMEVYGKLEVDRLDYDDDVDDNGFDRSSDGYAVAVGVEAALTGASYLDLFAGYSERDYEDSRLGTLDTPWFGGRLVWNPTGLTTVTLEGRRSIEETTISQSPGYEATRLSIDVDHELRRNLLLHGGAYTQTNDYDRIDREDDIVYFEAGATYMMNRYLWFSIEYTRRDRDVSPDDTRDYDRDLVSLTVRMQR